MSARYNRSHSRPVRGLGTLLGLALVVGALSGCSARDSDLQRFIDTTKHEPGGRVEPLPEVKPYEAYGYADQELRSPFVPGGSGGANANLRPDSHRNREYLEQFSLDTLKMVGTLNLGGGHYGLVQTKDGRVHRVVIGEHMGTNDGKITDISASKIALVEIIPDGLGGYIERPAALALNE
ncbi:MAG TPA: pilus assembly protein PilP [Steroidobacteraceae bacterium]|jgi:type IV pilus assembly protein PilP|nr:pilus assembly protein PilP [Steroidobacteraceae bacterium]